MKATETFMQLAQRHWDNAPPDWVIALAEEADATSASRCAKRIGMSIGVIGQICRKKYPGSMGAVAAKVKGALLGETVECPVLGELRKDRCLAEQKKNFAYTSAVRTRLFNACRNGCVHSRIGVKTEGNAS